METERRKALAEKLGDYLRRLQEYDPGTFDHCQRVGRNCWKLAAFVGLNPEETRQLVSGGQLHDVGKLGVPVEVLNSSEPLDDFGVGEIQKHPRLGASIAKLVGMEEIADLILTHHEPGYPRRVTRGEEERADLKNLLRLADRFDALSTQRAYKPALSAEKCREVLLEEGFAIELIGVLLDDS